jgi:hypothetical protein
MSAAEQTREVVELAVGYTKQIVEALTPIAKQAYDIGLLTLRIDAVSVLIPMSILFIVAVIATHKYIKYHQKFEELWESDPAITIFGGFFCVVSLCVSSINVFSTWLWVKAFSPELWLAHQAVERLLK